jgi:pimeloyl-ACP methyl ester carboxylesterase
MKRVVRTLIAATLSPPRAVYDPDTTISAITCGTVLYHREIVHFTSDTSLNLIGSLWSQFNASRTSPTMCLIYLHSLGTNQFESINLIPFICTSQLSLFAFDFPGCGISEGKATPLDGSGSRIVQTAVRELRSRFQINQFALWGRSLGASIALHAVSISNDFDCIVADSPFRCARDFLYDQAKANKIPQFLIRLALPIVQAEALKTLKMNIDYPFPINFVQFARAPLLLGHGSADGFVPLYHSEAIFAEYGGSDKQLYIFDAQHNTSRPSHWYRSAVRFVYRRLRVEALVRSYEHVYRVSILHAGLEEVVMKDLENGAGRESGGLKVKVREPEKVRKGKRSPRRKRRKKKAVVSIEDEEDEDSSTETMFPKGNFANTMYVIP